MKEVTSIAEARRQRFDEQARRDFLNGYIPRLKREFEAVLIALQQMEDKRAATECLETLLQTTRLVQGYIDKSTRLSDLRQQ